MIRTELTRLKFPVALLAFLLIASQAFAQVQVKGKVTSDAGPEPGVIVFVKGNAGSGTMTDADGNYSLTVAGPNEILIFSLMGYKEQEIKVGNRSTINVQLEEDANLLEEVLVVGYGTQKKEFVVGSVSQVSSKDLLKAPNTNVSSMLAGRLAEMTAVQTTGIPGGDQASLLVRGTSTFNSSSPLILVDGVERSMNYINPNDIASISILKDAATAAIYGVRGGNGVIMVTTKSGSTGKAQIVYDGSASFDTNTVTPELLTADEYIYWHNKAREMDNQTPFWTPERIQSLKDRGLYAETDNWALIYNDYGLTRQHNISASGGTEKFKYYTSVGYMNQQGILKNTSLERYNVRAHIDAQLSKGLRYDINLSAANSARVWPGLSMRDNKGKETWQGEFSPLRQACYAIPILATEYNGLPLGYTNGTYTYTPLAALNTGFQYEDRWMAEVRSNLEYDFSALGLEILKGLKAGVNLAYNFDYTLNRNYLESFQLYQYSAVTDDVAQKTSLGIGENNFNKSHSMGYNLTIRPQINYERDFGKNHISAIAFMERYTYHGDTMTGSKTGYAEASPIDISFGQTLPQTPVSGGYNNSGSFGTAGRVSYAYDKKYLAEVTLRADASYKFAPKNRWGFFPSVALGWVLSEENFMKGLSNVNFMKIRFSAGILGKDDTEAYLYMQTYKSTRPSTTFYISGQPTSIYYTSNYVYDDLTWSRTNTYNVGYELKMFGNRLSLDLDVFYKYTSRILEYDSLGTYSPSLGGNNPSWMNTGAVDNRGFDMTLSWGDAFASGWSYTVTGILSWSRNRLISRRLSDSYPSYRAQLGQPMGSFYGFHALGLFQTQEEADQAPTAPTGYVEMGAIKYQDVNGDGKISSTEDFVKIGRSSTPEMTFSMNFDVAYKGISLSVLLQGATLCNYALCGTWANDNMDNTMYTRAFYGGGNTLRYLVEDAWTPENTGAHYPKLSASTNANNAWISDWWIRDGSYLRVKNAQLAYDFPTGWFARTPVTGVRVFLAGTNLLTFSHFKYIDPENPGINNGYYPQQRTVSLGAKVTF
ncbi:MAG: TonB-dependent receptor [Bacteroidales bacterium]|nr:TonB-dependent receptor [Bacteroidales bacterium]